MVWPRGGSQVKLAYIFDYVVNVDGMSLGVQSGCSCGVNGSDVYGGAAEVGEAPSVGQSRPGAAEARETLAWDKTIRIHSPLNFSPATPSAHSQQCRCSDSCRDVDRNPCTNMVYAIPERLSKAGDARPPGPSRNETQMSGQRNGNSRQRALETETERACWIYWKNVALSKTLLGMQHP